MNMIDVTFHRQNIYADRRTKLLSEFFESFFNTFDLEDFPSISWAEYEMIVDH